MAELQDEVRVLEHSGANIAKHIATLAQAHGALIENEVREGTKKLFFNAFLYLATLVLSISALLLLGIAAAELLVEHQPVYFSRAGSIALVGGVFSLGAILFGVIVSGRMKGFSLYPEKSLASFKETAECLLNQI